MFNWILAIFNGIIAACFGSAAWTAARVVGASGNERWIAALSVFLVVYAWMTWRSLRSRGRS